MFHQILIPEFEEQQAWNRGTAMDRPASAVKPSYQINEFIRYGILYVIVARNHPYLFV